MDGFLAFKGALKYFLLPLIDPSCGNFPGPECVIGINIPGTNRTFTFDHRLEKQGP